MRTSEQDNPASLGGPAGAQLRALRTHLEFSRQNADARMRVDWCTAISPADAARFIRGEVHRKINAKAPDTQAPGRLAGSEGQRDIAWFRRHLQARAVIHRTDGNGLPARLRARMARAHHPRLTAAQVDEMLREYRRREPAWMGAPDDVRTAVARGITLRHALACQGATRRQGRTARLEYVNSCRICGTHQPDEQRPSADRSEGCDVCRQLLITDGDMICWLAAVDEHGVPLGSRTRPRDHQRCPDWPDELRLLAEAPAAHHGRP